MKFKVNYIDGQDNVFKSFYTEAVHARACLDELYLKRGNFDHKVISILCPEEGLLYEFGDNQAVNRAVLEPAEALKLYGNGPKITLPEPVPSEITGEMFAKELSVRLNSFFEIMLKDQEQKEGDSTELNPDLNSEKERIHNSCSEFRKLWFL